MLQPPPLQINAGKLHFCQSFNNIICMFLFETCSAANPWLMVIFFDMSILSFCRSHLLDVSVVALIKSVVEFLLLLLFLLLLWPLQWEAWVLNFQFFYVGVLCQLRRKTCCTSEVPVGCCCDWTGVWMSSTVSSMEIVFFCFKPSNLKMTAREHGTGRADVAMHRMGKFVEGRDMYYCHQIGDGLTCWQKFCCQWICVWQPIYCAENVGDLDQ